MPLRRDPQRITMLVRQYQTDTRKRVNALKRAIREFLIDKDALGLKKQTGPTVLVEYQQYRFQTDDRKVETFQRWLQEQIDTGILTTDYKGDPWNAKYIDRAYEKGAERAFMDARRGALQEGQPFYEGTKEEFLRSAFRGPIETSKVKLLATRAFNDMRGFTDEVKTQANRILATGISQHIGSRKIARQLFHSIDTLTRKRALVIARTEMAAAHAEGQLDAFQELDIQRLGVQAEWHTAGDDRVCPLCAPLEGQTFTIEEARGMIPRHPNCRCAWIPENVLAMQKRRQEELDRQLIEAGLLDEMKYPSSFFPEEKTPPPTALPTAPLAPLPTEEEIEEFLEDVIEATGARILHTYGKMQPSFVTEESYETLKMFRQEMESIFDEFGIPKGFVKSITLSEPKGLATGQSGVHIGGKITIAVRGNLVANVEKGAFVAEKSVRGALRHELGHAVDRHFDRPARKEEWRALFAKKLEKDPDWLKKNLSKYGATNPSEAFAEAFSFYMSSSRSKLDPELKGFIKGLAAGRKATKGELVKKTKPKVKQFVRAPSFEFSKKEQAENKRKHKRASDLMEDLRKKMWEARHTADKAATKVHLTKGKAKKVARERAAVLEKEAQKLSDRFEKQVLLVDDLWKPEKQRMPSGLPHTIQIRRGFGTT